MSHLALSYRAGAIPTQGTPSHPYINLDNYNDGTQTTTSADVAFVQNVAALVVPAYIARCIPPIGRVISLKVPTNGMSVCADNYGNNPLVANRPLVGQWEQFLVVSAPYGCVALKALVNNKYVCADMVLANPPSLIANRTQIGGWESYLWVDQGPGLVALESQANGQYVNADFGLSNPPVMMADAPTVGSYTSFQITLW